MKRKPPLLDKPYPKHRPVTPEEAELWAQVAAEKRNAKARAPKKPPPAPKPARTTPSAPLPAPPPAQTLSLDSAIRSKIRKGGIALDATLDLHGHTRATAQGVLLRFITEAQARGLRTLLVITGKGKNSSESGVLGNWLERMAQQSPLNMHIRSCEQAAPPHGGSGAWYIRLRKPAYPMP
jgi:DNA-nicking Smr family endonuclease